MVIAKVKAKDVAVVVEDVDAAVSEAMDKDVVVGADVDEAHSGAVVLKKTPPKSPISGLSRSPLRL